MEAHDVAGGVASDLNKSERGRKVKKRRLRPSGSGEESPAVGLIQVSSQVPREVMHAFDAVAGSIGVNRQQLIREALTGYAAMLVAGVRIYQQPGVRAA